MALSGRFVLLALLGLVPVLLLPGWGTVLGVVGVLRWQPCGLDLGLAASLRSVDVQRQDPGNVTLQRRGRFSADGPQPAAGAGCAGSSGTHGSPRPERRTRSRPLDVPAGERRRASRSRCARSGAGYLLAPHVTAPRPSGRCGWRPASARVPCPGSLRVLPPFHSRRHLPSKLRKLRELDGKAAVQIRGAGTEFDSLRDYVRG